MPATEVEVPQNKVDLGGRPVKYTKEFLDNEAEEFLKWMKLPKSVFFKRFAINRGYSPSRLIEFANQNERFSVVYRFAQEWQEMRLAEGGLTREFDAGFTKFVMAKVCGWREEKNVNITSNGNPLPDWAKQAEGQSKDLVNELIKP